MEVEEYEMFMVEHLLDAWKSALQHPNVPPELQTESLLSCIGAFAEVTTSSVVSALGQQDPSINLVELRKEALHVVANAIKASADIDYSESFDF